MGKLLDQVIEIHKNRISEDTSTHNIEIHIPKINKAILKCAENGFTTISIYFYTENDILCTAKSYRDDMYEYTVKELKSIEFIRTHLTKYYVTEGFVTYGGNNCLTISWEHQLRNNNE